MAAAASPRTSSIQRILHWSPPSRLAARNKRERNFARVEYRVSKNLVGYEKSLNDNRSLDRFRLNSRPLLGREFNRCTPLGNEIYYHGQAIRQERSRTSISAQTYYEDPARDREERPSLTLRIDLSSAILYSPTTIDFLPLSLPPLYPSDYLSSSNRRGITLTNVPWNFIVKKNKKIKNKSQPSFALSR